MTLEDHLAEIAAAGWLLNNMFQRNDGLWQANLRNATHATQWGLAKTPSEALSAAFDKMHETVPLSEQRVNACIDPTGARPALREVIKIAPLAPFQRRF